MLITCKAIETTESTGHWKGGDKLTIARTMSLLLKSVFKVRMPANISYEIQV